MTTRKIEIEKSDAVMMDALSLAARILVETAVSQPEIFRGDLLKQRMVNIYLTGYSDGLKYANGRAKELGAEMALRGSSSQIEKQEKQANDDVQR